MKLLQVGTFSTRGPDGSIHDSVPLYIEITDKNANAEEERARFIATEFCIPMRKRYETEV